MITVSGLKNGQVPAKYPDPLRVRFPYDNGITEKMKALPERWYVLKTREWEIPRSSFEQLVSVFGSDNIELKDVRTSAEASMTKRELVLSRLAGITPVIPFRFKTNPFLHQIEGFNYGMTKSSLLIADEQGLGKTKQSIDIAVARRDNDGVKKCLIVCGVNSVKYNWEGEIKTHSDERSMVIDGNTSKKKVTQIDHWVQSDMLFGIINIEAIRSKLLDGSETNAILERLQMYIDSNLIELVVVDEIHKAKNPSSQQGQSIRLLRSKYRIGLTGTPLMNNVLDLWNLLCWLGVERRNYFAYRKTYCTMGGYNNKKVTGYKNLPDLHNRLNRVMLRRKKDEVLDLPEKIRQIDNVQMTSRQTTLYNQIREGLISQIGEIRLSPNPLTQLIRLRQVTGGVLGEDDPKLDRLKELMEEIVASGKKAVIFSQWSKVTRKVQTALKQYKPAYIDGDIEVMDRQKEVKRFQENDACKVIVGTIGSMGTGLTLTAGTYVIFMDKAWTPADNDQAEDRTHRIGMTGTVNVITLVVKDSIDEKIEWILENKRSLMERVVEGQFISPMDRANMVNILLGLEEVA